MYSRILSISLLAAPLVSAHGLISSAKGDVGGTSVGLGVKTAEDNTLNDVTIFSSATGFGKTGTSGIVVPATLLAAQASTDVAQVSTSAGVLTMIYHQINADGAGPITCSVSADASGKTFTTMTITTNVPGTAGKSTAANKDFPLVASMPADTSCTGTVGSVTNACIVKCQNPSGPFGSNLVVTQGAATTTAKAKTAKAKAKAATTRELGNLIESLEDDLTSAFTGISENANASKGKASGSAQTSSDPKNGTAAASGAKKAGSKKGAATNGTATATGKAGKGTAMDGTASAAAAQGNGDAKAKAKAKTTPRDLGSFIEPIEEEITGALTGDSGSSNGNSNIEGNGLDSAAKYGTVAAGAGAGAKKAGKKGGKKGAAGPAGNGTEVATGKAGKAGAPAAPGNGTVAPAAAPAPAALASKGKAAKATKGKANQVVRVRRGEGSWFLSKSEE